jgi:HAD superfamily hydrolase (TIGR01459 family)
MDRPLPDPAPTAATGSEILSGLGGIAGRYDLLLCDVWGVIHDGLTALPASAEALTRFRAGGGRVVLVSNAPRPGAAVVPQLDRLAFPRRAFDLIVTSGDLTRSLVAERARDVLFHLGPARDQPLFEGLPGLRFGGPDEADLVVCSGLYDDDSETPDDYAPLLARLRERRCPMICANPDLVVERGDRLVYCAGAIAGAYEAIGGEVIYAGKPHRPVYEAALSAAERIGGGEAIARDRVLMVGDAIRTDITGAVGFGIDSLFVARGIHAQDCGLDRGPLDAGLLKAWLADQVVRPTYTIEALRW